MEALVIWGVMQDLYCPSKYKVYFHPEGAQLKTIVLALFA